MPHNYLLETFEEWSRAMDEGFGTNMVYLDYRKAFDMILHGKFLKNLRIYGVPDEYLRWIEYLLAGRTMKVGVNGSFSTSDQVKSGVSRDQL